MSLINSIDQFDQKIFLFLNELHSPFMDYVMWYISGKVLWVPLYLIIIYYLIRERKKNIWITLIAVFIMVILSDQLANVIKETVHRFRPTHNPDIAGIVHIVRNYHGGEFGFVSNHAANASAVAVFVSKFFTRRWIAFGMFCWALLVSYSRIYLGVHYPLDILGGAILGIIIGISMFWLERIIIGKYSQQSAESSNSTR
jgi:undecaprenyl-diphosphatase